MIAAIDIGANVRERRRRLGLSQQAFASRLGMSRAYLTRLEQGRFAPRFDTLTKLAEAFDVEVTTLLKKRAA